MVEEESAACNSIANCNCSVYSYHSVARFGSALHQKHWHQKHLRWVPEQRRAPMAPSSASALNAALQWCDASGCVKWYVVVVVYTDLKRHGPLIA